MAETGLTGELARTQKWDDIVGQALLKEQLENMVVGARTPDENGRQRDLEHILLAAPYGYGKTSVARLVADLCDEPYHEFFMPTTTQTDLIDFFDDKDWEGGVVTLDELHTASRAIQLMLFTAVSESVISFKGFKFDIHGTSFIGTTNEARNILAPLRSRFLVRPHFVDYTEEDMALIVTGMARRCGLDLPPGIVPDLARASAGVPRSAAGLVVAARVLASRGMALTATAVLRQAGLDTDGLSPMMLDYLRTIRAYKGTTGLRNICAAMCVEPSEIEEFEPFMVRRGYVTVSGQGRTLKRKAIEKLDGRREPVNAADRRRRSA